MRASYTLLASKFIGGPVSNQCGAPERVDHQSAFASAVMQDNPVGYWRLDETNSPAGGNLTAADQTGSFNGVYGPASADGVAGPVPPTGFSGP